MHDYIAAFRRRQRLFLLITVPICLVAIVLSLALPDQYSSSVRINVDLDGSHETLEPIELATYADQYIAKLSDSVLVSETYEALAKDASVFVGMPDVTSFADRTDAVSHSIDVSVVTQPVLSPNGGREVDVISGFRVTSVGPDPEFVYRVADYVAARFIEADKLSRTERASSTSTFLRDQMREVEAEIVSREDQIANFKVANACCLPELTDLNMGVIQRAERDLETLQPRLRTLETERKFLQAELGEARDKSVSANRLVELEREYLSLVANYGPDHPDVGRVKREIDAIAAAGGGSGRLVELQLKLAEARQRYSDEHPDVIRYQRELAALTAELGVSQDAGAARLLDNPRYLQLRTELNALDSELAELRTRLPNLRQKIENYEDRLQRTPQIESEYHALNRKLQTARNNFDNLQQRLVIARQTEALEFTAIGARLTEVRPATVPQAPSGPPRAAIIVVGVFLAMTLGIGSMLVGEMMDPNVRGARDIETTLDLVPLAVIPVIESGGSKAVARHRQLYMAAGASLLVASALIVLLLI